MTWPRVRELRCSLAGVVRRFAHWLDPEPEFVEMVAGDGASPSGILRVPARLTRAQAEEIAARWREKADGPPRWIG